MDLIFLAVYVVVLAVSGYGVYLLEPRKRSYILPPEMREIKQSSTGELYATEKPEAATTF